jgi:hypothetical protein
MIAFLGSWISPSDVRATIAQHFDDFSELLSGEAYFVFVLTTTSFVHSVLSVVTG